MNGLDVLGIAKYPEIVKAWPFGFAAGAFANTFGNAWPVLRSLGDTGRCPLIRVHAVWEDDHKYNPTKHDPIIFTELERAGIFKKQFPGIEVQFSPFCEHNIVAKPFKVIWKKLREKKPDGVTLVNAPWKGAVVPSTWGNILNEVHGSHARPKAGKYNFSYDGLSCVDADVELFKSRHKNASTLFYWVPQFNGRKSTNDKTPRPERNAWPTPDLVASVAHIARMERTCTLPDRFLWKSHAEQHEVPPAPRELKPVLIAPVHRDFFRVGSYKSSAAERYVDGRFRYYFPEYGYKIDPAELKDSNGKSYGKIEPGFRVNEYRNKE